MATQQLQVQTVNFVLNRVSAAVIVFPIKDALGNAINVSAGWVIKSLKYFPSTAPNTDLAPESLLTFGAFSYSAAGVTWTLPNNHGISPKSVQNSYVMTISNDAGVTESLAAIGGLNIDLEGGLL